MNILAFDTSSEFLSIAATSDGKEIVEVDFEGKYQHAEQLIPLFEKAIKQAGFSIQETETILIGSGPGSFTGLRVGFATVQGLVAAQPLSVFSICSLDVVAQSFKSHSGVIAVVIDAHQGNIYTAIYESNCSGIQQKGEYACISVEEAIETLKPYVDQGLIIVGNALRRYNQEFEAEFAKSLFVSEDFWYPRSKSLIDIYQKRKDQLQPVLAHELLPFYMQEPRLKKKS